MGYVSAIVLHLVWAVPAGRHSRLWLWMSASSSLRVAWTSLSRCSAPSSCEAPGDAAMLYRNMTGVQGSRVCSPPHSSRDTCEAAAWAAAALHCPSLKHRAAASCCQCGGWPAGLCSRVLPCVAAIWYYTTNQAASLTSLRFVPAGTGASFWLAALGT